VAAGRIEIAEEGAVPVFAALTLLFEVVTLGFDVIGDHSFDCGFRTAVGVCGTDGAVFGDWDHVGEAGGVAVDGGGAGEDDVADVMGGHGGEEVDCTEDVCAVIFQRDFGGFANSLGEEISSFYSSISLW